ncbi:tRNA (guanosine(46)-N7)-methyltransferase TrmB [Hellea balneolensis]|uniref:tRNA (guanosine(46)-N7)-methyltransferase TrmB n=1 Tax=Hellea balneolensis TaxID=287478 RepID=UPI001F27B36F|nr:tRNA (guanosine(46)-N7)-methyltransferase TrmB [Hellea balneolensis]
MSPAQKALMENEFPRLDIVPYIKAGKNPIADIKGDIWLEIGFGGAEHLLWQAEHNPNVTLLGVEPFLNGVAKAVRGVSDKGLSNIRLHRGDARDVLALLPDNSVSCVFVLFPDPWHKARHNKRRIINEDFLEVLHRVIVPGGRFRFGSDIIDYVDWTLTRIKRHGGFDWPVTGQENWRIRPDDWPSTRYLEKALREGRHGHFFEFVTR